MLSRIKKMPARIQSRHWCFTLYNYDEDDCMSIRGIDHTYLVFGRETSATGTQHLQGYIITTKRIGPRTARRLIPRAHVEVARGTPQQNRDYCTKEGKFEEYGNIPTPEDGGVAERQRWKDAFEAAKEGRLDDIPADIRLRYYGTIKKVQFDHKPEPPEADDCTGLWIYGKAGTGKSRYARDNYPGAYLKDLTQWWDGYKDQEVVIIDDMDPYHKSLARLFKIWTDRYPFPAQVKGGQMVIRPKLVVVTSQYTIDEIWDDPQTREALHRRCKKLHVKTLCTPSKDGETSPLIQVPQSSLVQEASDSETPQEACVAENQYPTRYRFF